MTDEQFQTIMGTLAEILTVVKAKPAAARTASPGGGADDADLDSSFGDPEVRSDPKKWTGPSMKGKRYSQCPSEFLGLLAGLLEWQGRRDDEDGKQDKNGNPSGDWKRRDAVRARGWQKRNEGKTFAEPAPGEVDDSAVPF